MLRWIKFNRDYTVKALGGISYKNGDILQLPLSSAKHFVFRGVAEYCNPPEVEPEPRPVEVIEPELEAEPELNAEPEVDPAFEPEPEPKPAVKKRRRKKTW